MLDALSRVMTRNRIILWLIAASAVIIYNLPRMLIEPTGKMVFTGFDTDDQMFYFACSREAAYHGWMGLIYANPFSFVPNPERIYSQLYFVLNGWVWRLSGLSFPVIDQIQRLIFGTTALGLAGECFLFRFGQRRFFWPVVLVLFFGGGGAWIMSTIFTAGVWASPLAAQSTGRWDALYWLWSWVTYHELYEGYHSVWGMNLFRRLSSAHQVFYHTLFFAGWLCLLRRKWAGVIIFSFLLWWAHPFTAIDFAAPVLLTLLVTALVIKEQGAWNNLIVLGAIAAAALAYYLIWLPLHPGHAVTQKQMMEASGFILDASRLAPALGLLLAVPFALYWRRVEWRSLPVAATICLLVCIAALTFHDRLMQYFGFSIQPMHFEQGYLFFGLLFLGCEMMDHASNKRANTGIAQSKWKMVIIVLIIISFYPDNIIYYVQRVIPWPTKGGILLAKDEMRLVEELQKIPGEQRILTVDENLWLRWAGYAAIVTRHRFISAHPYNTPFYAEKTERMKEFLQTGKMDLWKEYDPQILVITKREGEFLQRNVGRKEFETIYEDESFVVWKVRE